MIIFTTFTDLTQPVVNAIVSWKKVFPEATLITFDGGTGNPMIGHRRVNHYNGLPLVNEMFGQVYEMSIKGPLLFINSDCILTHSMAGAVAYLSQVKIRWLATGRRSEIEPEDADSVEQASWEEDILAKYPDPEMLPSCGADWFLYPRSSFTGCKMPPFAIARTCYDNWIIWDAHKRGVKVIDCTNSVTVYHQIHPERPTVRRGPLAQRNYMLAKQSYPDWNEWKGWIREADMTLEQMRRIIQIDE